SPLGAYLTGEALQSGEAPQRALFPGPALSPSQRAAAEAFWGSSLSAVQGPPGTGKTRLILHLCAEALVRQVEALSSPGRAAPELLLITSSNNRAVDNVLEPLSALEGLPLALRAGSRQACEHQLRIQLQRARAWLERAASEPQSVRSARLVAAKAHFGAQLQAIERQLAPRRVALELAESRARLEQQLEQCVSSDTLGPLGELSRADEAALRITLEALKKRLLMLSAMCEVAASAGAVRSLELHYERTAKRHLPAFTEAALRAKLELDWPLPPPAEPSATATQRLEAWEDAAELALTRLALLDEALKGQRSSAERAEKARRLRQQLAALEPATAPTEAASDTDEPQARELFSAALAAREAWAGEHADELLRAVSNALRVVEQERSLRPLFRSDPSAARSLCRLFAIWGSTLLSLGNCLPSELESDCRVVIDEAGQCHPAHAVSALLRAEAALVIGDVHQLTPVIELGADDELRLLRSCGLATSAERLLPYRVHADAQVSSQSLADRAVARRGSLTDHFRCQLEIIARCDALCGYGLTVHTPRVDRSRSVPYLRRPLAVIDLCGEQARWSGSWCNELELHETLALAESLLQHGILPSEIAVITPYRGQLEGLRRGALERRIPLESSAELAETGGGGQPQSGLALGTVHRFQGGERSIVLFSSVVTQAQSLPFLNARPNLLNVALSRAQHHFVCLGHAATLATGSRSRLLVEDVSRLLPSAYGGAPTLFMESRG
ncbi:MAG TPA: AAA domain-containing protein, partial [Polyangiaceae bacterium]|nr:AAA domain-containing protein [Polyangiaceae bacterium]